jgi:hypothetical protein
MQGRGIAALALAALLLGSAPAMTQTANCRDDLIKVDQNIQRSRNNLEKSLTGTPAVKCVALRQHVATLNVVKTVFARCDSSANKAANAKQTNGAIAELTKQVRQTCPSPAPAPAKKN